MGRRSILQFCLLIVLFINHGESVLDADVIIIGSGAAGISAAKHFYDEGMNNILILEPTDAVGGDARAISFGGYVLQIGSQFLEGATAVEDGMANNPLYDLAIHYNITLTQVDYDDWMVRDLDGTDITEQADLRYEEFYEALEGAGNLSYRMQHEAADMYKPDASFRSALRKMGWSPRSSLDDAIEFFDIDFASGATPEECSLKYYYDYNFDDYEGEILITDQEDGGFSRMFRLSLDDLLGNEINEKLLLNHPVTRIEERDQRVLVTTPEGKTLSAKFLIVTSPLEILQNKDIEFQPPLPEWKQDSINQFASVRELKVFAQFPSAFWDDAEWIVYAGEPRGYLTLWLNWNKIWPGSNILQVTIVNEQHMYIEDLPEDTIKSDMMAVLKTMYGGSIPDPINFQVSRCNCSSWDTFGNWPIGYPAWQKEALAAPVGRVYFANDVTHSLYYGYQQSAYFSGENVASTVTKCIKEGCRRDKFRPDYEKRACTYSEAINYNHDALYDDGTCRFPEPTHPSSARRIVVSYFLVYIMSLYAW